MPNKSYVQLKGPRANRVKPKILDNFLTDQRNR